MNRSRRWLHAVIVLTIAGCTGSKFDTDLAPVDGGTADVTAPADAPSVEVGRADDASGQPTPGECVRDSDCVVPLTEPSACAEATCDAILRTCSFRAKDADGDGYRTATCSPTASTRPIPVGDDCDDADPTAHPGAVEVCDGKDHTCGAPTGQCSCVNGTMRACYTGPTGTADVGVCKRGMQGCTAGIWGVCAGQVLPALAATAPPDLAHPCDGTNYWCDPAGVLTTHCAAKVGECATVSDCVLPVTEPPVCAEATCDPVLRTCGYRAKDGDADAYRAATCKSVTAGKTVAAGDDCDDADATAHPGAAEVCDGKDHTCGAATGKCTCVNGTMQSCYTGPAGTAGTAACKAGSQLCSNGAWGACMGQVLPALAPSAPPDDAHPCNGTNYWCDPAGVLGSHCPACLTTSPPKACGSASTCNAAATQPCSKTGTYGTCAPAAITTCAPSSSGACTTCSTLALATAGTHVCTSSCSFAGTRCTPPGSATPIQLYPGNAMFSHQIGVATNPANPAYWASNAGEPAGYLMYGPYATLPAGRYRITFSFYGQTSSDAVLEVVRNGVCGGTDGGLCPVTVNPSAGGNTTDYTYDFDILADCTDKWEIRVRKVGTGALYLYTTYLYYLRP